MIRIELQTEIEAPISEVFDCLTDLRGYNKWMPKSSLLIESTQSSDGPVGRGTRFSDKVKGGKAIGEITKFERPGKVNFRQSVYFLGIKALESRPAYTLESNNGSTKVHHIAEGNLYGLFKLFRPIVKKVAVAERKRTLHALKKELESTST